MDVFHQILRQSPIGGYPSGWRSLVVSLFVAIVITLLSMAAILLVCGNEMNIRFGY